MKQIIHAVHIQARCGVISNSLKMFCESGTGAPFKPPAVTSS
jgi:hypothetical protein